MRLITSSHVWLFALLFSCAACSGGDQSEPVTRIERGGGSVAATTATGDGTGETTSPVAATDAAVSAKPVELNGAELFKSKTCFTCHGADGRTPIMPIYPKIGGQSVEYAMQQMNDIKSGARANGQAAAMKGVMHLVDDAELKAIAEYIANDLVPKPNPDAADAAALHAEGAKLFKTKTCFTCHGADAKTPIMPNYPRLAGQNRDYALQQMNDIKSGTRANGQTAAMKAVMHLISDEELALVADYLSALQP
jgi:cytochrome c